MYRPGSFTAFRMTIGMRMTAQEAEMTSQEENSSKFSRGRATTRSEFLKVPPGAGDNLSAEDIAAGYTDYVIWNRFRATDLDIDGELEMECVDSGMVLLKGNYASIASAKPRNDNQLDNCRVMHEVPMTYRHLLMDAEM